MWFEILPVTNVQEGVQSRSEEDGQPGGQVSKWLQLSDPCYDSRHQDLQRGGAGDMDAKGQLAADKNSEEVIADTTNPLLFCYHL